MFLPVLMNAEPSWILADPSNGRLGQEIFLSYSAAVLTRLVKSEGEIPATAAILAMLGNCVSALAN